MASLLVSRTLPFAVRKSAPKVIRGIFGSNPTSSAAVSALFMSSTAGEDTVVARCTQKIQDALEPSKLIVTGMHDDPNGSHIAVEIVSNQFEGKRSVIRQRMVYKAIWDEMQDGGAVHAVDQIIAKTPEEDSK